MVLCEEEKKKDLIDIMKTVEGQIVKAIEFNLEEVWLISIYYLSRFIYILGWFIQLTNM